MPERDYYSVLGVSESAGEKDIRRAFRKLAKEYHPDANQQDKDAEKRFKEISEAYEVLSDGDKRAQYDQLRRAREMGFGGPGGAGAFDGFRPGRGGRTVTFGDLGDIGGLGGLFSDMFGREPRYSANAGRTYGPQKGEDLVFTAEIPFDLAIRGGKTTINVPRSQTCARCHGSGAEPGSQPATCPACAGKGTVSDFQGAFGFSRPCTQCLGRGTINSNPCRDCSGAGTVRHTQTISVAIPPGVKDGAKIRLSGQGEAGIAGGPAGDLYLLVRVAAHPEFERRGNDIHSEVEVEMASAALGTKVAVNTLGGTVTLTVPPGTQPGAKLRLKGRGVKGTGGKAGHHYVTVKVRIPGDLSERQRELLREFEDVS